MLLDMSKRASKSAASVPAEEGQDLLLFEIAVPEQPTGRESRGPKTVGCTECGRPLRAKASVEAGVGDCCAAKVGRAVIIASRSTSRSKAA